MIGKLRCWLIRALGGSHIYRHGPIAVGSKSYASTCKLCGHGRTSKRRVLIPTKGAE